MKRHSMASILWVLFLAVVGCGEDLESSDPSSPGDGEDALSVELTSPLEGTTITQAQSLLLEAEVIADAGVESVAFFVDSTPLSTASVAPFSASWSVAGAADNGDHTLTATVYDRAGNDATSDPLSVTVDIAGTVHRDPDAGVYGIWYGHDETVLSSPHLRGGQVVVQWADCEPQEGEYDFSTLLAEIDSLCERGHAAIVQVNGNDKPDYLFEKVPYLPEQVHVQVQDEQGSLMFWHPTFQNAYLNFISAYAAALKDSVSANCIRGIRQNFNCFGTEICWIPGLYDTEDSDWSIPAGVTYVQPTSTVIEEYESAVVTSFLDAFTPDLPVLVRAGISDEIVEEHAHFFDEGLAGWFQTCASLEQNYDCNNEWRYSRFLEYARPGTTFGFAERSSGRHLEFGSGAEYWRVLSELHCGVAYIGTRRYAFEEAADGDPWAVKTLEIANRYAGFHALPSVSPGAWYAFRGQGENYEGDYSFLMTREPNTSMLDRENVGGMESTYGVWAQELPSGQEVVVVPDAAFVESLSGASLEVIWFDQGSGGGSIDVTAGDSSFSASSSGTDGWREETFVLADNLFDRIALRAVGGSAILHMVRVTR